MARATLACVFLACVARALAASAACPAGCECARATHVLCANRGLRALPAAAAPAGVRVLGLAGNYIRDVTARGLSRYGDLRKLSLQFNRIRKVHPRAFRRQGALEELYLGHNLLTSLQPGTLHALRRLSVLCADNNRIRSLRPESLGRLGRLVRLRLDGNALRSLPESVFQGLGNLVYLHLESNRLHRVHGAAFSNLTKLRYLNLSSNKLTEIRDLLTFSHLTTLQTLSLSGNQIRHMGPHVFQNQGKLLKLSLSNNKIFQVDRHALVGLVHLRELLMHSNRLRELPADLLRPLQGVEELDFSNNQIRHLPASAFHHLHNLQTLKLNNNRLTSLSAGAFTHNMALHTLELGGNEWSCDCGLQNLQLWMKWAWSRGRLLGAVMQCHDPARLRGQNLHSFNSSRCSGGGEGRAMEEEREGGGTRGETSRPGAELVSLATEATPHLNASTRLETEEHFERLLVGTGQEAEPTALTDACRFNQHFLLNVSVDHVTPAAARVRWNTRPSPAAELGFRVLFDRLGNAERFPRYIYPGGGARTVTLIELRPDSAYMVCVEAVIGGVVCSIASRDHCTGFVTLSEGRGPTVDNLHLVTVVFLGGNVLLLLSIGGAYLARFCRRSLQNRKSRVSHVRRIYSTRRPFPRTAVSMATTSATAEFSGYQSNRSACPMPEQGDLIVFPSDRFLDNSIPVRRDTDMIARFSD
ncbi:TLR4 interactor with leucine rich repeats [Denticeps clupeoides]|nr:TLR4 interactor with leucine rich repeats [Denticeps clupeoides]